MSVSRLQVYTTLIRTGLVPVFYMDRLAEAQAFMGACIAGGVRVFEFTNRGQLALTVFEGLRRAFPDELLGIGSIVDAPTASLYIAHGADFIVSPAFNADVASLCNRRKIAYIPGCATITEIQTAEAYGTEIIKLFPASVYGSEFVQALKAPMPWTRIMPTGGIEPTEACIKEWFSAGVSCVGIGSNLRNVPNISATCAQLLAWIAHYRRDDAHVL
jgi:2-dehydro-3-deoxyphosphogluconate aldolase/(4S)-4-hydroxy-2-oxoglutarate aldolase